MIDPLNGPWVGFTGNVVSIVEYRGGVENILENGQYGSTNDGTIISSTETEVIVNKVLSVSEWE